MRALAAVALLTACTMDDAASMNSTVGDGGQFDSATMRDANIADARHRDAGVAAASDAEVPLLQLEDGNYQCVGQSTTVDPCTEFLLNRQFQAGWSLVLFQGGLDIITAGFDLDEISCGGEVSGNTFRCFATMRISDHVCDDTIHLRPTADGSAVFWIGDDTDPTPLQAFCERVGSVQLPDAASTSR